ncbi:MAG TPA: MGMT family protein [Candidatus Limnocylindria bacterium]
MHRLRFGRVETMLGPIWVAETDAGVAACSSADAPDELLAGVRRRFPDHEPEPAELDGALLGDDGPRLDLAGLSPFDARVYRVVASVPRGETLTYGEVAALAGSPGAARAVGRAMARCPLFPAVPCHRVVRASDGWSGWGGDPAEKRRLLAAER